MMAFVDEHQNPRETQAVRFSKYETMGVDLALVADRDAGLAPVLQHAPGLSSRGYGIGCTAFLCVSSGDAEGVVRVDDGGRPYSNVWASPHWDAALRAAAIFASDEGLAHLPSVTVAMRSLAHDGGSVVVEIVRESLVRVAMGVPTFGMGSDGDATMAVAIHIEVPPGFETQHEWWAIADGTEPAFTVWPVYLRGTLHTVALEDDVQRLFRYVGPSSCLSPGLAGEPLLRLIAGSPPFASGPTKPVLDILRVDSPSSIRVDGLGPTRDRTWPQGDGVAAAAAVARAVAGTDETVQVPGGFGCQVAQWRRTPDADGIVLVTAGVRKVYDGEVYDIAGIGSGAIRDKLLDLLRWP